MTSEEKYTMQVKKKTEVQGLIFFLSYRLNRHYKCNVIGHSNQSYNFHKYFVILSLNFRTQMSLFHFQFIQRNLTKAVRICDPCHFLNPDNKPEVP